MGSLAKEIRQLLEENDVCEESEELDIDEIVGWAMEDDDCDEMDEGCGSKHKSDDDDDDDDDDEMDEDVDDDDLDEAFAYQAMKKKMAPSRDDELKRDSKAKKAERSKKIKALAKKSKLGPGKKMVFGKVVNVGEDADIDSGSEGLQESNLVKAYASMDTSERAMFDQLHMMASNEGRFYPNKPKEAVVYSFKEYMKLKSAEIRDDFATIQKHLVRQLQNDWQTVAKENKRKQRG